MTVEAKAATERPKHSQQMSFLVAQTLRGTFFPDRECNQL